MSSVDYHESTKVSARLSKQGLAGDLVEDLVEDRVGDLVEDQVEGRELARQPEGNQPHRCQIYHRGIFCSRHVLTLTTGFGNLQDGTQWHLTRINPNSLARHRHRLMVTSYSNQRSQYHSQPAS